MGVNAIRRLGPWLPAAAAALALAPVLSAEELGGVRLDSLRERAGTMEQLEGAVAPSLFKIAFTHQPLPEAPDHTEKHPGPQAVVDEDILPTRRSGYTKATLKKKLDIAWNDAGTRDGKLAFYAESVTIDYSLAVELFVTSDYPEGGCAYRATWEHELSHGEAFIRIFHASREGLLRILEQSIGAVKHPHTPPTIGTEESPELLEPDARVVARYQSAVYRKLAHIIDSHRKYVVREMEKDRNKKDAPEAYYKGTYSRCPGGEW